MNSVVLIGRLARDPELSFVPATGMAVSRLTLAVDKDMFGEKKQQAISQGKPTADFISTTQTGEKRYTTNVIADKVEFIGSKNQGEVNQQGKAEPDGTYFDNLSDDGNDIFQPVDDEEIPF